MRALCGRNDDPLDVTEGYKFVNIFSLSFELRKVNELRESLKILYCSVKLCVI
jgi:hypothetical protein